MSPSPRSKQFSMPTPRRSLGTEAEREGEMIFEYHPRQRRQKQSQTKTISVGGCDPLLYLPPLRGSPASLPPSGPPCVGMAELSRSSGDVSAPPAAVQILIHWRISALSQPVAHLQSKQWFLYKKKSQTKRCYLCVPAAECCVSPLDMGHLSEVRT